MTMSDYTEMSDYTVRDTDSGAGADHNQSMLSPMVPTLDPGNKVP